MGSQCVCASPCGCGVGIGEGNVQRGSALYRDAHTQGDGEHECRQHGGAKRRSSGAKKETNTGKKRARTHTHTHAHTEYTRALGIPLSEGAGGTRHADFKGGRQEERSILGERRVRAGERKTQEQTGGLLGGTFQPGCYAQVAPLALVPFWGPPAQRNGPGAGNPTPASDESRGQARPESRGGEG